MTHDDNTRVLYNAACPVCSREIDHYAHLRDAQALQIGFDDLNDQAQLDAWGVSAEDAARRLHVRKNGQILSGIPAFVALWQDIPRYRWLARLVNLPGVHMIAVGVYERVLAPMLYRSHQRRIS